MTATKAALDAAIAANLPNMIKTVDVRLKRQTDAVATTESAIVEIEDVIRKHSEPDLVDKANAGVRKHSK